MFNEAAFLKAIDQDKLDAALLEVLPIVDGLARKLFGRGQAEDFKQDAILMIVETEALKKFDQAKGSAFSYLTKVTQNALLTAWRNDNRQNVVAFGLPAKVEDAPRVVEIVRKRTDNAELIAMADAISSSFDEACPQSLATAGRYLASLGYNEAKRRALWAVIRSASLEDHLG